MDKISCLPFYFLIMIIDSKQGNVEVIGDVKEFKSSIDPKNLEFITTLLSSNLYSDPEQSFIREIVSNAWDSHVEAGTTDTPVIIKFGGDFGNYFITIRDYGTGLSPERFNEVYRNIGSSTKRESNDYIGGFGIGHLSPFACSNTVYITSYYEGTAYYYVGTKSNNVITYHQLDEKPTEEKNGVEITIKSIVNPYRFNAALDYIVFFPNIFIDGARSSEKINTTKLKKFKNFAAASIPIPSKILLGNVLYQCQDSHFSQEARNFLYKIRDTGIVVKFDVGELNITPNREGIIYNSGTISKIEDRILAARDELEAIISSKIEGDYDDLETYAKIVSVIQWYNPIEDEVTLNSAGNYAFTLQNLKSCNVSYKGISVNSNDVDIINIIFKSTLPNFKGVVDNDRLLVKNISYRLQQNANINNKKVLILNRDARLLPSVKLYLKEHYNGYGIMTDLSKKEFYEYIDSTFASLMPSMTHKDLIIEAIYDLLMSRAKRLDLNTDKNFLDFKKELSVRQDKGIKERETILYVFDSSYIKDIRRFSRFSTAIKYIRGLRKGIILAGMEADELLLNGIAELKGYALIKARKDIIADIKKLDLSCIVDINWLLKKDPALTIANTLIKYYPLNISATDINIMGSTIPESLYKEFVNLHNLNYKYTNSSAYKSIVRAGDFGIDPYTKYLCMKLKSYITKYNEARNILRNSGITPDPLLVTTVIMKTKAYRISGKAYHNVRNNSLIKILCKK